MATIHAKLPVELVSQILLSGQPSLSQLVTISQVCHLWYQLVFPTLYETLYLSWDAPIFATRILDEDLTLTHSATRSTLSFDRIPLPIDGFRVADHVQGLVLDRRMQREEPVLQPLEDAIVHVAFLLLKKLKRIDWGLPFLPRDMRFFDFLSFRCNEIEYISFDIPDSPFRPVFNESELDSLFTFSQLKHIRIKDNRLPYDPETNGHIAPSLVRMIMRSPNLEHLELELRENPNDEHFMSAGWLVEAISTVLQHTFEKLRVFKLGGTASIDSEYLLRPEENNLIRSFLFRHPNLTTLQLPWDWEMNALIYEPVSEPAQILRSALPNLRHFEGPTYLAMVILHIEDVAQRLESLGILDTAEDEESDLTAFAAKFPRLPNLRRLDLMSTYMLDHRSFATMLRAAPNIRELTVYWVEGEPGITREAITSLLHLRSLTIGYNVLPHLADRLHQDVSSTQETDEVFHLALQCPSLRLLRILPEEGSSDHFDYQMLWTIERRASGPIHAVFSRLRRLEVRSNLLLNPEVCRRRYNISVRYP